MPSIESLTNKSIIEVMGIIADSEPRTPSEYEIIITYLGVALIFLAVAGFLSGLIRHFTLMKNNNKKQQKITKTIIICSALMMLIGAILYYVGGAQGTLYYTLK